MTSLHKGFITAGVIHGALLTLWLGYELTGKKYRDSLHLDFTLLTGASSGAKGESEPARSTDSQNGSGEFSSAPKAPAAGKPATREGGESGDEYAQQNLSSISGMIHGKIYYPRIARKNNWQGRVLVRFLVDTDGKTREVMLRESSGHQVLDESALETIRELEGLPRPPVPVAVTVPVFFRLKPAN